MQLDNIDKHILYFLFNEPNYNIIELKRKIYDSLKKKINRVEIIGRIQKLVSLNILKVQGNINIKNLNYLSAFILLEMKNFSETKKIVEAYSNCPRIFLLGHINGQFDVIIGVIGQSFSDLQAFLNLCGPSNRKGVLHSEILLASSIEVPTFFPLNLFFKSNQEEKCGNICKECEAFLDKRCKGCSNF